ncbi:flagellar basal-body rod modification protein FlgD [Comamonas sp. BIGb0124]|uniref:flagellar hook assembly protein FlgD n=1 Tax=Comamonas sp. BIGb0124 TaxID=2485130 RepID=UPI000F47B179|nr:flagellar hook assembly protein FlgD [Comamonas sp. BIGb0124]ROR25042.1 flagellar basal-body rod modification protein FlgD [Comamonas sp. BIGb0124]
MTTSIASAPTSYVYQPSSSLDATSVSGSTSQDAQDRFMKLLIAQLNNQDPLNPMDNAEMTSQIAQINTVTGIQQLNTTVTGLASQINGSQLLQSGTMVGHGVLYEGNSLTVADKVGYGTFELAGTASNVTVQIKNPSGAVLDTVKLGALGAGQHSFQWDASNYPDTELVFDASATNGQATVAATPYSTAVVKSVGLQSDGSLAVRLDDGQSLPYSKVKAVF